MTKNLNALFVTLNATKNDPALADRGDRKLLITTDPWDNETNVTAVIWKHVDGSGKCPVLQMKDTEIAEFTEKTNQTRHYHRLGTEIYMILEGSMNIEVDNTEFNGKERERVR